MVFRHVILLVLLWSSAGISAAQTFTNEPERLHIFPDRTIDILNMSLADYNGDGRLDMYHAGRLYRQAEDGTFSDFLTRSEILNDGSEIQGGVFGDADHDGRLDLLVLKAGSGSRVYRNRTGEKFDQANNRHNIHFRTDLKGAFWRDVNLDGALDLIGAAASGSTPVFLGSASGTFSEAGVTMSAQTTPPTCGLAFSDYDRDGDADIYSTNCRAANNLLNFDRLAGSFVDVAGVNGVDSQQSSQSAIWFDYDNDGWEDLLVVNQKTDFQTGYNLLYHNDAGQGFTDMAQEAGIAGVKGLGSGPAAVADFDNDGWQDVYLPVLTRGKLFHNNGNGTFDERWDTTVAHDSVYNSVAVGDLNEDGWMDIVIPQKLVTAILINDGGDNHWVKFSFRDGPLNRFGVGVIVRVRANGNEQMRVISAGTGAGNQNDELRAHFGLGSATQVDRLAIEWPDGTQETYFNLTPNTHHTFVKGVGPNQQPGLFSQTNPPDGGFIDLSEPIVRFNWETSQDDDLIRYTVDITGPGVKLSFPERNSPFLDLDTGFLPENAIYEWSVTATDGYSVRTSGDIRTFTFGQPDVASLTLRRPTIFDFSLPRIYSGISEFADFDADGDLDLLIGGNSENGPVLQLFETLDEPRPLGPGERDGAFIFKRLFKAEIIPVLVSRPSADWADLDLDGNLDLILSGIPTNSDEPITAVYENQEGILIARNIVGVPGVWGGNIRAGDVDSDGDTDLLVVGAGKITSPLQPISRVYLNQGDLRFEEGPTGLPGIVFGDAAWADVDGDGDLDVALTGDRGNGNLHSGVYINEGASFRLHPFELPNLVSGSVAWGDVDGDLDVDLLITGGILGPGLLHGFTGLYINEVGTFVKHPFQFDGVIAGTGILGDYDGDGDLEVFVIGARTPNGEQIGRLYRNVNNQFIAELDLKGLMYASASFGDYNQDGDADLIISGIDDEGEPWVLFYINQAIPEHLPQE